MFFHCIPFVLDVERAVRIGIAQNVIVGGKFEIDISTLRLVNIKRDESRLGPFATNRIASSVSLRPVFIEFSAIVLKRNKTVSAANSVIVHNVTFPNGGEALRKFL